MTTNEKEVIKCLQNWYLPALWDSQFLAQQSAKMVAHLQERAPVGLHLYPHHHPDASLAGPLQSMIKKELVRVVTTVCQ